MNITAKQSIIAPAGLNAEQRLDAVIDMVREMSSHTDPHEMVSAYVRRIQHLMPVDRRISLSRRGLTYPQYRISRSNLTADEPDPWINQSRLPLLSGGLLAELIYAGKPRIIDHLEVALDDPAYAWFEGQKSLVAIPLFDQGEGLNMVVLMRRKEAAFDREAFPDLVWVSNLFGRATHTLVLKREVQEAYNAVDRELKTVADIQRSLLPITLPKIPTMDLAAYYQTSQRAGGDYYDFFPLPDGEWGILIADVSGHGTPAAVMMAITHSIAHNFPGPPTPPGSMLTHLNEKLSNRYTQNSGTFITAFYGIYDPKRRTLTYACAGHPPPRIKHCHDGTMSALDGTASLPLGISYDETYSQSSKKLRPGDQLIFYTDGITEASNGKGDMFGTDRLDRVVHSCRPDAEAVIRDVLASLEDFTNGLPAEDDRTLLIAKIS